MVNFTLKRAMFHGLLALGGSALSAGIALADHAPEHLEKIKVTDSLQDFSFTNPSVEQAKESLRKVPGATTLIKSEDFTNRANTGGMADILARTPGVFSESRFGNQESRISIRGSGITMTYGSAGIRYLRDGLPLINADGYGSPELIEPMTAQHMEVYRGANALQYGSATLGGAVNFVSKTGRNYNGYGLNMMFGSHDYYRPQIQAGGLLTEKLDYYATYTGSFTDGFRDHSQEDIHRFFGNLGYRWDERNETRVYFTASQNRMQLPGSLRMWDQTDTYTANGVNRRVFQRGFQHSNKVAQAIDSYKAYGDDRNRDFDMLRGDIKHTVMLGDDDRLDIGGWYENKRFDHHTPQNINSQYNNAGGTFRYLQNDVIFGHANHLTVGGYFAWGDNEGEVHCQNTNYLCGNAAAARSLGLSRHILQNKTFSESMTVEGYAEDRFELNDMFDVLAGMQAVYAKRQKYDNFLDTPHLESVQGDFSGWSPKMGLIWKADKNLEVYGNASRSYEPPNANQFAPRTSRIVNGKWNTKLDGQEATTVELGVRGEKGIFSWDVAAYHSWLRDEILSAPDPTNSLNNITMNAKDTTHSGIEAGGQALIPVGLLGDDKLRANVTYNYTRFLFNNDRTYKDNYIPSIPNHFGMGELLYEHPTGFYVGPNVKVANTYFSDYSNTRQYKAPGYSIIGARAGYKDKKGWSVFVEGRNLTNENWVSNVSPTVLAGSGSQIYNPGYDRQIFGGFSIDFH